MGEKMKKGNIVMMDNVYFSNFLAIFPVTGESHRWVKA
jgi:hypothetical protein